MGPRTCPWGSMESEIWNLNLGHLSVSNAKPKCQINVRIGRRRSPLWNWTFIGCGFRKLDLWGSGGLHDHVADEIGSVVSSIGGIAEMPVHLSHLQHGDSVRSLEEVGKSRVISFSMAFS